MSSVDRNSRPVVTRQGSVRPGDGGLSSARRGLWERSREVLERRGGRNTPLGFRSSTAFELFDVLVELLSQGLKLVGLYQLGVRNALDVRRRELELHFEQLPIEFDGYRILHLSDLHLDAMADLGEAISKAVAGCRIDLCVLTGDYRKSLRGPFIQILDPLRRILDGVSARDGILATLGNHDTHKMGAAFDSMGVRLLANQTVTIARGGARLHVTGLDDVSFFYTPMADSALDTVPEGYSIALVHSPEMAVQAAERGYSLYLCGHTHGGQICLPGGRPMVKRLIRNRSFAAGLWRCGRMSGYTNSGAGVSGPPLRYFSRGEAALVTLRRAGGV